MDLFGQVNAESAGHQAHFWHRRPAGLRDGRYSLKGRQELHLHVLYHDCQGRHREEPYCSHLTNGSIVTDPRSCTLYRVTEYGMVNPKGMSTWEPFRGPDRHCTPRFRDELIKSAEAMRHLEKVQQAVSYRIINQKRGARLPLEAVDKVRSIPEQGSEAGGRSGTGSA